MKKIIALLLSVLAVAGLCACGEKENTEKKDTEPKISQMKSICELAVMDCYYHNVAKFTQEDASGWWIWTQDKHFWIEYGGVVTLGVDVSLVSMEIDGDKVTITIPPATVQSCKVDESTLTKDSYIVDKDSAAISAEDEVLAFSEAQKKLEETASADKALLAEAQQRTQILLEDYIKNIGNTVGKEYSVTFKYINADGSTSDKSPIEGSLSENTVSETT